MTFQPTSDNIQTAIAIFMIICLKAIMLSLAVLSVQSGGPFDRIWRGGSTSGGSAGCTLRILSWNIERGQKLSAVADSLKRLAPSVALLQEVDMNARRTGYKNVAEELARRLGMNYFFAAEFEELGQGSRGNPAYHGQAILTALPVTSARITMTSAKPGQRIPFYLLPYIGGSDDLRGSRPYRFTGPNAVVYNAEYRWEIFSGLDGALFLDAGKVMMHRGHLGMSDLETSPGFVILDRHSRRYFVKFDPLSNPEMATGADQIASKIFYALGYHVPENYIVYFRPQMLTIGEDVTVEDKLGRRHKMTGRDLSEILLRVHKGSNGCYRVTASLALPGKNLGPYRYFGTRRDDPNDTVPHKHRRDLRGMHLACALVNHDDSRSINSMDILTEGPSGSFVKHYQLDFGSTLGSGSDKINSPRSGGEYLFSRKNALVQLATLGLAVPHWARAQYPDLKAVGRFESAIFDPERWVPEYPNPAFLNRLPDDEFWMAKQIVNLRDADIRAIVNAAQYSDARAADWVTRCLIERRDKIGRAAFAKVLPVDRFEVKDGRLHWLDFAAAYGIGKALETGIRWSAFDNEKEASEPIAGENTARLPRMPGDGYWVATLYSLERPGQTVRVYVRKRSDEAQAVGVERTW